MQQHRDSQKRLYMQDAVYFVTMNTKDRYPFFKEPLFCDLFLKNLKMCKQLKKFRLYGWFLGYDHCHLMIQPGDKWNYSEVMHNLKRVTSLQINQITEGEDIYPRLRWTEGLHSFRKQFIEKYDARNPFPKFTWQKSFHDHYARNQKDVMAHLRYIMGNPDKHELPKDWPYIFTNPEYLDLLDKF